MKNRSSSHILLLFIVLAVLFFLPSCTIKQEIFINADASGNVEFDIQVEDFFTAVVEDFTVFIPEEESDITDLNIKDMQNSINSSPYTSHAVFYELEKNHYTGKFRFDDAENLFNDIHDEIHLESLFSFDTAGNQRTLSLYLDINNYEDLTELIPLLKDPTFAIFGPEENVGVSEADYLDMISYLLGEEGPGAIERSYISIIINTDSPIISHTNGTIKSDKQIEFRIPIIDFLLLSEPIHYSVTW